MRGGLMSGRRRERGGAGRLCARLRRELWHGAAFGLLPKLSDPWSCGWLDGYCCILAEALLLWVSGAGEPVVRMVRPRLMMLAGEGKAFDHVVLQLVGRWFLDGDGVSSRRELLLRWQTREGLRAPRLLDFDEQVLAASKTPRDAETSHWVADCLAQALGPFTPALLGIAGGQEDCGTSAE
jgi:hypothetical protein